MEGEEGVWKPSKRTRCYRALLVLFCQTQGLIEKFLLMILWNNMVNTSKSPIADTQGRGKRVKVGLFFYFLLMCLDFTKLGRDKVEMKDRKGEE